MKPRVALVIFNSLSEHKDEFWGNLKVSSFSGELHAAGIPNDIFLVLMKPGAEKTNLKRIDKLVSSIAAGGYNIAYFDSIWLPSLRERLETEIPGITVTSSGEGFHCVEKIFPAVHNTFEAVKKMSLENDADIRPNFNYIQIGARKKLKQTVIDAVSIPCSFQKSVDGNPYYKKLTAAEKRRYIGCAYCVVKKATARLKEINTRSFINQVRCFQSNLPHLEKIALPSPENFFDALIETAPELISGGFRPIKFYMQFRPDVIVERHDKIRRILDTFGDTGFGIFAAVVGFENFVNKELLVLNRGYKPDVIPKAIETFRGLKSEFPGSFDTSETIASFILFNPYTALEDIEYNVRMIGEHDFSLFKDININKVRINPDVALYALANKDGLIAAESDLGLKLSDLPRGSYHGDYEYSFRDARVAEAYRAFVAAESELKQQFYTNKLYILGRIVEHLK